MTNLNLVAVDEQLTKVAELVDPDLITDEVQIARLEAVLEELRPPDLFPRLRQMVQKHIKTAQTRLNER